MCSGTGKTSLITALAGQMKLSIYIVSLTCAGLTDELLLKLFNTTVHNSILLLEDIDTVFDIVNTNTNTSHSKHTAESVASHAKGTPHYHRSRTDASAGISGPLESDSPDVLPSRTLVRDDSDGAAAARGSLTFAGVLNAIDGIAAQTGRLLFMTTNHRERLDPALIRPGRIDYQLKFESATKDQIKRLFLNFYSTINISSMLPVSSESSASESDHQESDFANHHDNANIIELSEQFSASIPAHTYTMSQIQGLLMRYRADPLAAIQNSISGLELHTDDNACLRQPPVTMTMLSSRNCPDDDVE